MGRHILNVEIVATRDEGLLHLYDASDYSDGLGVSCGRIEITVPGFKYIRLIETAKNFNVALNGKSLEIIGALATELPPLPDGLYHIKYSVSPNELVFVETDHLRTTVTDNLLLKARCALDLTSCTPEPITKKNLLIIRDIEDYIKAAIASVELCGDAAKGMELFTYARQQLDRYLITC